MIDTYTLLVALAAVRGLPAAADLPSSSAAHQAAAAQAQAPYKLNVATKDGFIELTLEAEDARLSEIAADLSTRLRATVSLGPSMRDATVSAGFIASPLEPALTSLAPRVLVDYEIRPDAQPVPRVIHLLGQSDALPPTNTTERGVSQGLFISGHTEDTTGEQPDDPLKVMGDTQSLTLTVKRQPLSVVAMAIGDVLGIPVDTRYDATELVDLDLRDALPEDAIPRLSPNLRLQVRVDVNRSERMLLRLVLAPAGGR